MKNKNVLFQIKDLEKLILRNLKPDTELEEEILKSVPTPTQMQIVGYILDNMDKEIYQKDLENVLNLRRATVSGVLQTMEKRGFIERIVDETDTRTKKIILQKKAKDMFEKNQYQLDNLEKVALKDISEEDLKVFSKVINQMMENIQSGSATI